ncbi:hypothetical protein FNU79_01720 [Deinococcus detaillensis]|uniref:Uncharacterized protein n=1 Tax=Deinococcus detaillensis TaxID=2592048 RepID=A0A553V6D6_9DEIO|nr:hypothetical protein [Deinococcus detaillensis]TSA87986.1 hypothetical protein FNU79_01720 [Deinococcus detaillensis]
MTKPAPAVRPLFIFVRRHQGFVALGLVLLVASALALDYFRSDLLGPHLIGLRLIYAVITLLTVTYIWIVSIWDGGAAG